MRIFRNYFLFASVILVAILFTACTKDTPTEPVQTQNIYEKYLSDTEAMLSGGDTVGLIYVHPEHRLACKTIKFRLSKLVNNGIEDLWESDQTFEIQEQTTAPFGKQNIGEFPVLFKLPDAKKIRIDAFQCEAYQRDGIWQFQTYSPVAPVKGKVNYLGDYTRTNLDPGLDIYPVELRDDITNRIAEESELLAANLHEAENLSLSITNYDGSVASYEDISTNQNFAREYFVLSRKLRKQANDSLAPFLGMFPEFGNTIGAVSGDGVLKYNIDEGMKTLFVRHDLNENFNRLTQANIPFSRVNEFVQYRSEKNKVARQLNLLRPRTDMYDNKAREYRVISQQYSSLTDDYKLNRFLDHTLTEEREKARIWWRLQAYEISDVITHTFKNSDTSAQRQNMKQKMDRYIAAKYSCLEIEFLSMMDRPGISRADKRYLSQLMNLAEQAESIAVEEFITNIEKNNLYENRRYKDATTRMNMLWDRIKSHMENSGLYGANG